MTITLRDQVTAVIGWISDQKVTVAEISRYSGRPHAIIARICRGDSELDNISLLTAEAMGKAYTRISARNEGVRTELDGWATDTVINTDAWDSYDWPKGNEHTRDLFEEMSHRPGRGPREFTVGELIARANF
jgi:hypothetical protein